MKTFKITDTIKIEAIDDRNWAVIETCVRSDRATNPGEECEMTRGYFGTLQQACSALGEILAKRDHPELDKILNLLIELKK